jgi:hypothetical protein
MEWTEPEYLPEVIERHGLIQMLFDVPADLLHRRNLRILARRLRAAAQACPIARFLGFLRPSKERYVFAARALGGAGRAAVHPRARNGKEELAIVCGVPGNYRSPPLVVRRRRHRDFCLQLEYRIGCHSEESLGRAAMVSYPKLAVKPTLLQDAGTAILGEKNSAMLDHVSVGVLPHDEPDSW